MTWLFRATVAIAFALATLGMWRVGDLVVDWLPWSVALLALLALGWVSLGLATIETLFGPRALAVLVRLTIAGALMLATAEVALTAVVSRDTVSYYVWRPNVTQRIRPPSGQFPGIADEALFSSNSEGLRGREHLATDRARILAVGGSTTESLYVDDAETWPEILRAELDAEGIRAWVGNAGKSGTGTEEHIVLLRTLGPEVRPDVTLLLVGINDLLRPYAGEGPPPFGPDGMLQYEYTRARRDATLGPERSALYWQVRRVVQSVERASRLTRNVYDRFGPALLAARERRQAASFVERVPDDLEALILAYEARLREIARLARAMPTRLVIMTQPSLYSPSIGADERRVLSLGHFALPGERSDGHDPALGPERYFGEQVMTEMLRRYNEATLKVCMEERALCLDLATVVPPDVGHMYDDVHFNRRGSSVVGQAVARFLIGSGAVAR